MTSEHEFIGRKIYQFYTELFKSGQQNEFRMNINFNLNF